MAFHPQRACADLFRLALCMGEFRLYRRLQARFAFDPWHVKSPYRRRPYKRRVVALADACEPRTVVEIGCGLGEIISHVKAPRRFGFDCEAAVIEGATYLHGAGVVFHQGDLREPGAIAAIVGEPIDVLIAVNWPHMLAFDDIEAAIRHLIAATPVPRLIIDTIRPGLPGYAHYHTPQQLTRLGTVLASQPGGDHIRDLHTVQLDLKTA